MSKIIVFGRLWAETTLLPTFFIGSSAAEVVELEKLPDSESFPRWPDMLVLMLQGEKHARMSEIIVFGRFWAKTTLLTTFFRGSSACNVVALENLCRTESIGYILRMFLAVKKH